MRNFLRIAVSLVVAMLCFTQATHAQYTLNPKTYESPSGEYQLHIDPSQVRGVGPSTVTMSHAGTRLWQKEHPFSLWHAHVTNDGHTVGYTYIHGYEGMTLVYGRNVPNTVDIVFLDTDGEIIARHDMPRQHSGMLSNPPDPYVPTINLFVPIPSQDRVLVVPHSRSRKTPAPWWMFELSSGHRLDDIANPATPIILQNGFTRNILFQPLGDHPVLVVHALLSHYNASKRTQDAFLGLLGLDGNLIWSTTIQSEYDHMPQGWHWLRDPDPADQLATVAGGFQFHSWSTDEIISFECVREGAVWAVQEIDRQPAPPAPEEQPPEPLETIALELAGSISLGRPVPTPFEGISYIDVDGKGNIGFVPLTHRTKSFFLVSPEGDVIHRELFADFEGDTPWLRRAVWAGNDRQPDRWLLFSSGIGDRKPAAAWYDVQTRSIVTIPDLGFEYVRDMRPLRDGGLIAAGDGLTRSNTGLVAFNPDGSIRWKQDVQYLRDGLAITTNDEIALLTSERVLFFNLEGNPSGDIDLATAFGRQPRYPAGMTADTNGGVIVLDASGTSGAFHIARDGSLNKTLTPRFDDGAIIDGTRDIPQAPGGTLWTTDGHSLLMLGDDGIVERIIGEPPEARPLRKVSSIALGPRGNIYALNEANAAIHVFDKDGNLRAVLPPPSKSPGYLFGSSLVTVEHDGTIHAPGVRYARDEKPLPPLDGATSQIAEYWLMHPHNPVGWSLGYEYIALFQIEKDDTTTVLREVRRRPDNTWVERPNDGAVAQDGSLAVVVSEDLGYRRGTPMLCIYDASGEPMRMYAMPDQSLHSRIAYAHPYVVTIDHGNDLLAANLYDVRTDAPPRRIVLPESIDLEDEYWYVNPSPNAGEFLLRGSVALELHRIRLPDEPEPHK